MSALAAHTVLPPYDLRIPFFPAAPRGLKKQYRAGGLVSFAQAEKFMADHNRWAERWNEQERAFQAYESNDNPDESPDGYVTSDLSNPSRWNWHPADGPWVRVVHNFTELGEGHQVREYPLTLVARLKDWSAISPRRLLVTPDQIIWATWANFWHDSRVPA